ncbi:MAG: eight-cysteine-cluster domain-containing protein [Archaeoglobaceae archaeon]
MFKKLLFVLLIVAAIVFVALNIEGSRVEKVLIWENGRERVADNRYAEKLIEVLEAVEVRKTCSVSDDVAKQRAVEVVFTKPVDLGKMHGVTSALFVLGGEFRGLVITRSVDGVQCWSFESEEVERLVFGYSVGDCLTLRTGKSFEYDERTGTLVAYVSINCCGVDVTVEEENGRFRIVERQYGELCRCECLRKVVIYDVPIGARVEFVDIWGDVHVLVPSVNLAGFCGWSTYGECSSDDDCVTDGCSGQICRSRFEEPVVSTCEWFDCHDAAKHGVGCGCVDGRCQWTLP